YLAERAVLAKDDLVQRGHQLRELPERLLAADPEAEGELPHLVRGQPHGRVDVHGDDLLRRLLRDLLDLDSALRRRHEGDPAPIAVDDRAEVELARDVEPLLDVEAAHLLPLGARLVGHELHPEDLLRERAGLGGPPLRDLDAATLAAAARVDLRLDDND